MIIQIEAGAAAIVVSSCAGLCALIMKLSLKPVLDNQKAQAEILKLVKGPDDLANLIDNRAGKLIKQHHQECDGRPHGTETRTMPRILGAIIVTLLLVWLCCSCAHYSTYVLDNETGEMVKVAEGTSYGAFRDLNVSRTYDPVTGKLINETIITKSTTSDILMGMNQVMGTMVDAAGKIKP